MKWPARVQAIVNALAAGVAHEAPDDLRRATTMRIAQQCRFELGADWGTKRADPTRPLSADVICVGIAGYPFVGWDWSVPGGIAQYPESIDLTGQTFVEVMGVDHLDGRRPSPSPQPAPIPTPIDWTPVLERLNELEHRQVALFRELLVRQDRLLIGGNWRTGALRFRPEE